MYFKNCECVNCDKGQIKTAVTIQYLVLECVCVYECMCVCVVYVCDQKKADSGCFFTQINHK